MLRQVLLPADVGAAVSTLAGDPAAALLAGGTLVMPAVNTTVTPIETLVSTRDLGLAAIAVERGVARVGAATTLTALGAHPDLGFLRPTVASFASPIIRNLATVGGNVAHADPANDHPAVMLALRAEVVATGPDGERTIPVDDFFVDTFTTSLQPDEVLTEIRIPHHRSGGRGAYTKLERKVGDFAIAAVAAQLTIREGTIVEAGVAFTNVGPSPVRAVATEAALVGKPATPATFAAAAEVAAGECDPASDLRGPADYKRSVVRTLTERTLAKAAERAG